MYSPIVHHGFGVAVILWAPLAYANQAMYQTETIADPSVPDMCSLRLHCPAAIPYVFPLQTLHQYGSLAPRAIRSTSGNTGVQQPKRVSYMRLLDEGNALNVCPIMNSRCENLSPGSTLMAAFCPAARIPHPSPTSVGQ